MLIVLAGLPGAGKTTVAAALARRLPATFVRVDAIETGLVAADLVERLEEVGPAGYVVAAQLARACLGAGLHAVVDAVNPVAVVREAWQALATETGAALLLVEVVCSDPVEHRRRVEARSADLPRLRVPTWEDVVTRHYEGWSADPLRVDTVRGAEPAVEQVLAAARTARTARTDRTDRTDRPR